MPDVILSLTDEQHDAIAAALPDAKKSDAEIVEGYLQGQVEAICSQFVKGAKAKFFKSKGLPEKLGEIGLADADVALLVASKP